MIENKDVIRFEFSKAPFLTSLSIKKGPIFNYIEKLVRDSMCLFDVYYSINDRSPSFFEYNMITGDFHQGGDISFYYRRSLKRSVFWKNKFFESHNKQKDLKAIALTLSDSKNYTEKVGFLCSDVQEHLVVTAKIYLYFENNQLKTIIGLNDYDFEEIFREKIKGFRKSLFDFKEGPLKDQKIENEEYETAFKNKGISSKDLIKELYMLFKNSVKDFEIKS
ncbi:MAG TPA: hypothetical protein ENH06_01050 [bacterium]|nr:hypothetical protein [bacterium]